MFYCHYFSVVCFFYLIKYHSDKKHTFIIVKKHLFCSGNGDSAGTQDKATSITKMKMMSLVTQLKQNEHETTRGRVNV